MYRQLLNRLSRKTKTTKRYEELCKPCVYIKVLFENVENHDINTKRQLAIPQITHGYFSRPCSDLSLIQTGVFIVEQTSDDIEKHLLRYRIENRQDYVLCCNHVRQCD